MPARKLEWDQITPHPLVLFSGKEDYLAARASERILAILKLEDAGLEVTDIDAERYAPGELAGVASPSLFDEPRLVRIARVQKASDTFLEEALAYAAQPFEGATLVFRHDGSSVRGKKLLDAIRAAGVEVVCAPLKKDADRAAFVSSEVRDAGRAIAPGAVRALVEAFGDDLAELANAVRQLIDDSEGEITEATVRTYYSGHVETTSFQVADAAIAGNTADALAKLRSAIDSGAGPVPIVAAFAMRVRQLAKVSTASGSDAQAAKALGMPDWLVRRTRGELRRFSDAKLATAIEVVAAADADVKGMARDQVYALERMVRIIAAR